MFKYGRIRKNPSTARVGSISSDVGRGILISCEEDLSVVASLAADIRILRQRPGILGGERKCHRLADCRGIPGRTLSAQAQAGTNVDAIVHQVPKECRVSHLSV